MPSPKRLLRRLLGLDRDDRPAVAPIALISMPVSATPDPTPDDDGGAAAAVLSPEAHAARLLDWLQDEAPVDPTVATRAGLSTPAWAGRTGDILARDLAEMHAEMCLDLGIEPLRWSRVSEHFRRLIGERKRYAWHRDMAGAPRQRLCVMSVPVRVPWTDLPQQLAA